MNSKTYLFRSVERN